MVSSDVSFRLPRPAPALTLPVPWHDGHSGSCRCNPKETLCRTTRVNRTAGIEPGSTSIRITNCQWNRRPAHLLVAQPMPCPRARLPLVAACIFFQEVPCPGGRADHRHRRAGEHGRRCAGCRRCRTEESGIPSEADPSRIAPSHTTYKYGAPCDRPPSMRRSATWTLLRPAPLAW